MGKELAADCHAEAAAHTRLLKKGPTIHARVAWKSKSCATGAPYASALMGPLVAGALTSQCNFSKKPSDKVGFHFTTIGDLPSCGVET